MNWDIYHDPKTPHPCDLTAGDTVELINRPGERFGVVDVRFPIVELQAHGGARLKAGFRAICWPREGAGCND